MSGEYLWFSGSKPSRKVRTGIVRKAGKRGVQDDDGRFHPVGDTFMWAIQGSTNEWERPKLLKTLDYLAEHGQSDYARILGQVDWATRPIDPRAPTFKPALAWFMDRAHERGIRTLVTGIGGQGADDLAPIVNQAVAEVTHDGRDHKLFGFEQCNEWFDGQPDKMTFVNLEKRATEMQRLIPQHLVTLSCQKPEPRGTPEGEHPERDAMMAATKRAGVGMYTEHPRRTRMDSGWDNVSQAYDQRLSEPYVTIMGEPVGPQSSVVSEMRPLFLASMRVLNHICSGAAYCRHFGQMVTGQADPKHGRPEYLWEVPGASDILRAVRGVDPLIPENVEDWIVRNNARDDHPMPLPDKAFWSDRTYANTGWVYKNYAAISEHEFINFVMGVRGGTVSMGTARRRCVVQAWSVWPCVQVAEVQLEPGQGFSLTGVSNTEMAYALLGTYL